MPEEPLSVELVSITPPDENGWRTVVVACAGKRASYTTRDNPKEEHYLAIRQSVQKAWRELGLSHG